MLDPYFNSPFKDKTSRTQQSSQQCKKISKQISSEDKDDRKNKKKSIEINLYSEMLNDAPEISDEEYPFCREYTHADTNEYPLHRLGYYWPLQSAAFPLVK